MRVSIACQCLPASSCTQLLSTCLLLENSNNHPTDVDLADAQFEAGHVRDEVAERCHARRGSRPSWRSGETTGNQLKYLDAAKELVHGTIQCLDYQTAVEGLEKQYKYSSTRSQPPVGVLQQQELLFHVGHQQVQVKRPSCVDHRGIELKKVQRIEIFFKGLALVQTQNTGPR